MAYLYNIIQPLEHSTGYWALALVIQPVGVGPVLDEELDQVRVAVVRRQHELVTPCPVSFSGTVADAPNQNALLTASLGCGADCLTRESVVQGGPGSSLSHSPVCHPSRL